MICKAQFALAKVRMYKGQGARCSVVKAKCQHEASVLNTTIAHMQYIKRAAPLPPPPLSAGEKESDKKGCACPENTQHFILHWAESRQSGEGRVVVFLYQLDIQRRDFIWNFSLIRPKRCSHIAVVLRTNLFCLWRRTERSAPTPLHSQLAFTKLCTRLVLHSKLTQKQMQLIVLESISNCALKLNVNMNRLYSWFV